MPNVAIPAPPEALFKLKFHQVAIMHRDPQQAVQFWTDAGFMNWTHDICLLEGVEFGKEFKKAEEEYFNYDICQQVEFCYMRYSDGKLHSRDNSDGLPPMWAHMAAYVEDLDAEMERIKGALGLEPYSVYSSVEHQNPYLVESGMRFYKCLYDTRWFLGFNVKLTQKVFPGDAHYPVKQEEKVDVPVA